LAERRLSRRDATEAMIRKVREGMNLTESWPLVAGTRIVLLGELRTPTSCLRRRFDPLIGPQENLLMFHTLFNSKRGRAVRGPSRFRPSLVALEGREVPAAITLTTPDAGPLIIGEAVAGGDKHVTEDAGLIALAAGTVPGGEALSVRLPVEGVGHAVHIDLGAGGGALTVGKKLEPLSSLGVGKKLDPLSLAGVGKKADPASVIDFASM
jgi:hypothetical protein